MITYPATPVLIDNFLVEFNTKIKELLAWLDNPLGQVQTITKEYDGRVIAVPSIHTKSGEYTSVFPDDIRTNFSWFDIAPIELGGSRAKARYDTVGTFNMFLDLRKVYPGVTDSRNLENAKLEVINALYKITLLSGRVTPLEVSDNYRDVYTGYSLKPLEDKYFMQPYAGLSFSLSLTLRNTGQMCPNPEPGFKTDNFKSTDVLGKDIDPNFVPNWNETIKR